MILVILLRSLAVPMFVMTGVALGFSAALGASVIAFQGVGGDDGLIFSLPVVAYLFVASMVSDYAILVLSRVREELADGRTPAEAAAIALRTAGPSVAAAGIVLAAAFGVLAISPSNAQVGFAVGIGVLLSALVTARIFIPALTVLAWRLAWWPSRLARSPKHERPPEATAFPGSRSPTGLAFAEALTRIESRASRGGGSRASGPSEELEDGQHPPVVLVSHPAGRAC